MSAVNDTPRLPYAMGRREREVRDEIMVSEVKAAITEAVRELRAAITQTPASRRASRRVARMRERVTPSVAQPCPYDDGSCPLDVRKHYHYAIAPSGRVVVIRYGSAQDWAAFPPGGLPRP